MVFIKEWGFGWVGQKVKSAEKDQYAAYFTWLIGFGGQHKEGVWLVWKVKIKNLWSWVKSAPISKLKWGLRYFLRSDWKVKSWS